MSIIRVIIIFIILIIIIITLIIIDTIISIISIIIINIIIITLYSFPPHCTRATRHIGRTPFTLFPNVGSGYPPYWLGPCKSQPPVAVEPILFYPWQRLDRSNDRHKLRRLHFIVVDLLKPRRAQGKCL